MVRTTLLFVFYFDFILWGTCYLYVACENQKAHWTPPRSLFDLTRKINKQSNVNISLILETVALQLTDIVPLSLVLYSPIHITWSCAWPTISTGVFALPTFSPAHTHTLKSPDPSWNFLMVRVQKLLSLFLPYWHVVVWTWCFAPGQILKVTQFAVPQGYYCSVSVLDLSAQRSPSLSNLVDGCLVCDAEGQ